MKFSRLVAGAAVVTASLLMAGCAAAASSSPTGDPTPIGGDIVAPVTMSAGELQGESVDLVVGQTLNIDTGDLAVDSYTGAVADGDVAEFVAGKDDGSATFNPGVRALAAGTTSVTMTNKDGGIQPLEFTVVVTAR
ncbi:hypothetical protein QE374_000555 [Microbacterium sp. SORGH_AS428]|uniref:hypothetical protein n=1 Tax=Microbacterium sp. SORGH_AS_0428 TaxID=3041788 RepID=UPI00285B5A17|nr:hypothetical protein [Microbacterium sp. SORGH_AS_0428]MDR6198646.1 hypothetical protein [Microbacterium sp. SORGH_AS_0428]